MTSGVLETCKACSLAMVLADLRFGMLLCCRGSKLPSKSRKNTPEGQNRGYHAPTGEGPKKCIWQKNTVLPPEFCFNSFNLACIIVFSYGCGYLVLGCLLLY